MEIEIDYKGKKEMVVLRTLSWGENNECVRKGVITKSDGSKDFDFIIQQENKLLKSIEKAPFDLTIESLRKLPSNIGDKLFTEMMKLNKLDGDVTKNLNTPSVAKEVSVEK